MGSKICCLNRLIWVCQIMFDIGLHVLQNQLNLLKVGAPMQVEIVLRKFGNSTGAAFPPSVLKDLGLKAGQSLTMDTTADGKIVLSPKRKYTLAELVAQCDRKAKPPADMAAWDAARSVGQEIL